MASEDECHARRPCASPREGRALDGNTACPARVMMSRDDRPLATQVAAELWASLNATETDHPPEVEAAWASEIERRARRVVAGESAGIAWSDVRQRGEAELHNRR
jgi:hypothetical protein